MDITSGAGPAISDQMDDVEDRKPCAPAVAAVLMRPGLLGLGVGAVDGVGW